MCGNELKSPLTISVISTILPIHKTSGKTLPENYRPVALTSVLAKCMERIVSKHVMLCYPQVRFYIHCRLHVDHTRGQKMPHLL